MMESIIQDPKASMENQPSPTMQVLKEFLKIVDPFHSSKL